MMKYHGCWHGDPITQRINSHIIDPVIPPFMWKNVSECYWGFKNGNEKCNTIIISTVTYHLLDEIIMKLPSDWNFEEENIAGI